MTSRAKRPAKAAGIAGFSAALALAGVQLLQETVGVFTDRPGIKVAVIAAAAFAGLAGARVRERSTAKGAQSAREDHLPTLLAAWPAPRATDADPACLGVFPARRALPPERPYVERDVDRLLRPAIVSGAMVVLVGDSRAGASRTALHAVQKVLPNAAVIAPRSADSLCELLELEPPLHVGSEVVVWLDGLDRYAEVLDDQSLDALDEVAESVTIVATARREDWDAWLQGSGAKAPAARAVADRARVFTLPAELSREELSKARALYPGRDFDAGIGVALGSDGREALAPQPRPGERPEGVGEDAAATPWERDTPLIVPLALAAVALVIGAIVVATSGWRTPSIQTQLSNVKHKGVLGGARSVDTHTADLQGNGETSYVVHFRDRQPGGKRSDELRIYDQHGTHLVRAFRFAPAGRPAQFEFRGLADVDADGAAELIGGYDYPGEARGAMVPFAVDWDDGSNRYRVVPLDLGAPKLTPSAVALAARFRIPEQQYLNLYAAPTTFSDPADHLELSGHRVQDFTMSSPPYRMIAGWFLRPWLNVRTLGALEVQVGIFGRNTGSPRLTPCTFTGAPSPLVVKTREDRALESVFNEAYTAVSQSHFCSPYNAPAAPGSVISPVPPQQPSGGRGSARRR